MVGGLDKDLSIQLSLLLLRHPPHLFLPVQWQTFAFLSVLTCIVGTGITHAIGRSCLDEEMPRECDLLCPMLIFSAVLPTRTWIGQRIRIEHVSILGQLPV